MQSGFSYHASNKTLGIEKGCIILLVFNIADNDGEKKQED